MENWFREVGRPALFDALTGACDRIDSELDTGLKVYIEENARLSTELNNLKSRVSDVDKLKKENRSLQRELRNLKDVSRATASTANQLKQRDVAKDFRSPLAPRSVNQVSNSKRPTEPGKLNIDGLKFSELKEEYLKLDRNYTKLCEKYSELEGAHGKLNGRLRDMTKAYNGWMEHANKLNELCQKRSRTIKKLEAKLEAAAAVASGPLDASFASDGPVRPRNKQRETASDAPSESGLIRFDLIAREDPLVWPPTDTGYESLRSTASASASPRPVEIVIGSRTTQSRDITPNLGIRITTEDGELYSLPPLPQHRDTDLKEVVVKTEPSSDIPVVVSERCLRKRKHGEEQPEDLRTSTRVKTEDDSDPLITTERRQFVLHESIDFDVEGGRVETPRKRSRTKPAPGDISGSTLIGTFRSYADNNGPDGQEVQVQATPRQVHSPIRTLNSEVAGVEDDAVANSPALQDRRSSASTPLNCNTSLHQRRELNHLTRRKEQSSIQKGIASLGEDGDGNETLKTSTKRRSKTGRLLDLLNTPSGDRETISPLPNIQSGYVSTSKINEFQMPERRELPFGKGGLKKVDKISQPHTPEASNNKRASTNISAKRVSDERVTGNKTSSARPLRERPKSELGINDFKINPNANEGYTYAFTDVVRSKDERAGLTGCVQEGCCGRTFRLQARAQRDQTGPADFQILLEKHLGDDAWKLSTMTKSEKEELWLEAKTQELANEHGRHRHRFHRAASPAGYWRTDFPSTQEELQDKEEAERMTRQMIDERYREAMRPGGKWLFRDE
ncbi:SAE2-domain-containing protein [Hypoxylon sp. NC0597]|nr:SAE2-domain-containing protein [Hypoxylon sp. NC0597]